MRYAANPRLRLASGVLSAVSPYAQVHDTDPRWEHGAVIVPDCKSGPPIKFPFNTT